MYTYSEECLRSFIENQSRLFDEAVASSLEEADAFLEDCMAEVVNSLAEVRDYLDDSGMDVSGLSDEEVEEQAEVFPLPGGRYLIVEG